MPYRRNDSKIWYALYTNARGQRTRKSTGTEDRREAEAIEAKWRLEARRERTLGEKPDLTFEALMIAYLKHSADKRSIDRDRNAIKALRQVFAGRSMNRLGPPDIHAYKGSRAAQGVAPSTVNRELAVLSSAINLTNREMGQSLPNPASGRKHRGITHRVRWITTDEAARLLDACARSRNPHLADFVTLALHTGMRKNEILGLEWSRVDLGNRLLYLEDMHTKSGKRRSIPINAIAREIIVRRLEARMRTGDQATLVFTSRSGRRVNTLQKVFKHACAQAGITNFRIHDLRHTCAAWLVSSGVPLSEVRDLLGHCSVTVSERYAHLAPERVRQAVEILEGVSQTGTQERKKNEL